MLQSGFAHATVSKFLTLLSISSFFFENTQTTVALTDETLLMQLWRLVKSQLLFERTDGAIFGALIFYSMRQIERQMGSSKFAAFIIYVTLFSVLTQQAILQMVSKVLPNRLPPTGPYAVVVGLLLLYWRWVPRRRRVVKTRIFGILITEKIMTYLFVAQFLFAGGWITLAPSITGTIPASLYLSEAVPTNYIRTPEFVNNILSTLMAPFITTISTNRIANNAASRELQSQREAMQRRIQGIPGMRANNISNTNGTNREAEISARSEQRNNVVSMPSDESIQAIMELGFEREEVIASLRMSDNNVEIAAGRLLAEASSE